MMANMRATLFLKQRLSLEEGLRQEIVVWHVPKPLRGSQHFYKYRMVLIDQNVCVLRYDNEAGKGDHKHIREKEIAYVFTTIETALADFNQDVLAYWNGRRRR